MAICPFADCQDRPDDLPRHLAAHFTAVFGKPCTVVEFDSPEETALLQAIIAEDDARIRAKNPDWDAMCAEEDRLLARAERHT